MKAILPTLVENSSNPLYLQIYNHIKKQILKKEIVHDEKLPSLRNLSEQLDVSITTVELAYAQLEVEGYIYSKPQSGFYVSEITFTQGEKSEGFYTDLDNIDISRVEETYANSQYDLECFDFNKWKKCINKVFTQYSHLLMFESEPQGEAILRNQIAKYVYSSRGVKCRPEQIVIAAGTQQITAHLSNIMGKMNIHNVAVESPGYMPVNNIFRDRNFNISYINVLKDGIDISKLPTNISSAVYVNPSNQFPTGAVMPIGKRYKLLEWAKNNHSFILEDDYDSELRYFGRPIPALQGLDQDGRVVYLGSFSSTLFPSVKISYMVLPPAMEGIFNKIKQDYAQTCSKTEQLALAFFMEDGKYQTNIKKIRRLYSQKLQIVLGVLEEQAKDFITPLNTSSGINMILSVKSTKKPKELSADARSLGLTIIPANLYTNEDDDSSMIFYYNQVPIHNLEDSISKLISLWRY